MFLYHVPLQPPTAIACAAVGNFSGTKQQVEDRESERARKRADGERKEGEGEEREEEKGESAVENGRGLREIEEG